MARTPSRTRTSRRPNPVSEDFKAGPPEEIVFSRALMEKVFVENPRRNPRARRRNGFVDYMKGVEERGKRKGRAERAVGTAQTAAAVVSVGAKAAPKVAAKVAAKVGAKAGARAIPLVGEALMVVGGGKELAKAGYRHYKHGFDRRALKTDVAKVGAGILGVEDFVPDYERPAKTRKAAQKNPLVFDNRFAPEPMVRYPRSRLVASVAAPPRQRAQIERLADSPHTFVVVVLDGPTGQYSRRMQEFARPNAITLLTSLSEMAEGDFGGPGAANHLLSAFQYLHRLGDVLFPDIEKALNGHMGTTPRDFMATRTYAAWMPDRKLSLATRRRAEELGAAHLAIYEELVPRVPMYKMDQYVRDYIATHTNSYMSRRGVEIDYTQCVADWVALSELPSARARRGRNEPWLLLPPTPGKYPKHVEEVLHQYGDQINEYFPAFVQALLDDLDGSVFRI